MGTQGRRVELREGIMPCLKREGQGLQEEARGGKVLSRPLLLPTAGQLILVILPCNDSKSLAPAKFLGILPIRGACLSTHFPSPPAHTIILPYLSKASILVALLFINHSSASPGLQGSISFCKNPLPVYGHYWKCTNCHTHFHLLKAVVFMSSGENKIPLRQS